ncbi:hypothetical protein [Psychrobacter sp. WY6]|uniref:hypothetical protein n=1 Tax=Psychrobacter sp. WY6 TaxID=2708350 RepID=UPI002022D8E0|nr:hypothetical protein [Psychrobacter sp. WY6]
MVRDSITHNQNITAQVQARQNYETNTTLNTGIDAGVETVRKMTLHKSKTYQRERHKANKPLCQTILPVTTPIATL